MAASWERDTSLREKRSSGVHRKVHPPRMMATDIVSSKLARLNPTASSESRIVPSSHSRRSEYCNA
jgi:hypothetical protein